jgi:MFS family permease
MLWGILVYGIGSLCCYFSESIGFLLLSRFVQAFGASTGSVVTQTILRESIDGDKRHAVFAKISAAIAFTPALGPFLGGWIDQFFGFKAVFFTLVIMALGIYLYTFVRLPETRISTTTTDVNVFSVIKRLVLDPKVLAFSFLISGLNGIMFSYYAESPFIFMEYFRITPGMYGFLGIVVAFGSIVGALLSKRMLGTHVAEKIIFKGCMVVVLGSVLLIGIVLSGTSPSMVYMVGVLVTVFILFIGIGMAIPNCLSLALVKFQDVLGTASALFWMSYYFAISFLTWGMSLLHNDSLLTMPLYFLVIAVAMAIVCKRYVVM